jgi:hypothetical protein
MLTCSHRQRRQREPYGVSLPTGALYFLQGAENIVCLWKKSTLVPGTKIHLFFLKNLFGMPAKAIDVYAMDNSGIKAQPLPGSRVASHNRIHHLTHMSMLKFMGGSGLSGWYGRWATSFLQYLQVLDIGEDWVEVPDLMKFFEEEFGSAVLESMCGPLPRRINPNFMQDLKKYHYDQPTRLKCPPEWLIPRAFETRRKVLQTIKDWHTTARAHFSKTGVGRGADSDPYWGSEFMRSRQEVFDGIEDFDYDAYASSDLGLIWT